MEKIPGIWFPKIYEATKNTKDLTEIDTVSFFDKVSFHKKYASQSIPFVFKNHFPTYSKEKAIENLVSEFGDFTLSVRFGDMSNPENYINRRIAEIPLKEFIKDHFLQSINKEIAYAGSSVIKNGFLKALNIGFPNFYPESFFNEPRIWLGRAGTITQLHKDIPDNFAFNYFGLKKWIIYPPKDFPYLYMTNPNEKEYPDFGASHVNLKNIDLHKFPEFSKASGISFVMEQGDMLYLPAGWSHYVENLEDTLMINFWLLRDKSPAILGKAI